MPQSRIITTTHELDAFCERLQSEAFITLDTEFIREKTYFPQLCLIQVAGSTEAFAIDPLAPGMDLSPLLALLANPKVLKVFHAGRQDIEIFYLMNRTLPTPVYDTQIAAQFAGFGESISYSDFIRRTVNVGIDKASRLTDWSRRPLTDKQILYALADVEHLRGGYEVLVEKLAKAGRESWVAEEMQALLNPSLYDINPDEVWRRLKTSGMKPKSLAVLRVATAWREREAQKKNIPKTRLLRDDTLLELASSMPETLEDVKHIRGTGSLSAQLMDAILKSMMEAKNSPPESWPQLPQRNFSSASGDVVALLQMLLSVQCSRHNILPRLVATKDDLEALAEGRTDTRALSDWRGEIFGKPALALLSGELRLRYDPARKQVMLD